MAISFLDGFEPYGGSSEFGRGDFASGALKVSDECSFYGQGLTLNVDRLPDGKWRVQINGTALVFDKRPEFTIPQSLPAIP